MSQWDDRFEEHEIHAALESLGKAARKTAAASDDPNVLEATNRLVSVHSLLSSRLERVDPILVPFGQLNTLAGTIQRATTELGAFASNSNTAHLDNANSHAETILVQLLNIPIPEHTSDVESIKDAVIHFRRSAGQHLRRVGRQAQSIGTRLQRLEEASNARDQALKEGEQHLAKTIQDFVQDSTEAERKRSSEFADAIAEAKTTTSEAVSEVRASVRETAESLRDSLSTHQQQLADAGQARIGEIEDLLEQAREQVGVIARTGMAGGYQQLADTERDHAIAWRRVALFSLMGFVGFAVFAVFFVDDLGPFFARAFASLAFAVLAGYAGREAEKHQRREERSRRMQLELASIDPYLASLPVEERNAIKIALADRMFGREMAPAGDAVPQQSPSLIEFVRLLVSDPKV